LNATGKLGSFHVVEELRKFPLDSGAAGIEKKNEQLQNAFIGG
jgi:hypothetical protein